MKFLFYLCRWQLSTFVLAPVAWIFNYHEVFNVWLIASVANTIGAAIFFNVDKLIFKKHE